MRLHENPAQGDSVHETRFVEARDRTQAIALKIRGVIEEPHGRVFQRKPIEMPGQPVQDVVSCRIYPAAPAAISGVLTSGSDLPSKS